MCGWVGLAKLITDLDMRNGHKEGVRVGFIYINDDHHFIICYFLLSIAANQYGPVYFYYGCREKTSQPFRNELDAMMQQKVISKTFVAFSRESGKPKVFV